MRKEAIFLVGYMGSGKTTMGRKLARRLGWSFVDLDHRIVAEIGMSIPEYFDAHGEEAFRDVERDLLRALDLSGQVVVGTGGGTPCFHDNMAWMNAHGVTVYLRMSSKALWRRLGRSDVSTRPVLRGLKGEDLLRFIEEKLSTRSPYYEQAVITVDPIRDNPADIIDNYRLTQDKVVRSKKS